MKQSPYYQNIQSEMVSGRHSAVNFLGNDSRCLIDIIKDDQSAIDRLGITLKALTDKMKCLTESASRQLGSKILIDGYLEAYSEDNRGRIPCPFNDGHFALKRVTYVKNIKNGKDIKWSDLNIHMIEEHCFFEGRESEFRIDPEEIYTVIF